LGSDDVHLWVAALRQSESTSRNWSAALSAAERDRAARFRRAEDRWHYMAAHAILRFLLAGYTGVSPEQLLFDQEAFGKPYLRSETQHGGVTFNLSHSGDMALFGIARGRRIGVDIERIRPEVAFHEIAAYAFSPKEISGLRTVPPERRREAFFVLWTRREARLKATGQGLAGPPASVAGEAGITGTAPQGNFAGRNEPGVALRLIHRKVAPDYLAAAAVTGPAPRWRWQFWAEAE